MFRLLYFGFMNVKRMKDKPRRMDNLRFRLIFDVGNIKEIKKEHFEISKTAKFGCEML